MIGYIKANAEMTIQQMRLISRTDFGYTRESVEWLEGYIERLRQSGELQAEATRDKLVSVFGSFLGECIVRCYGGVWAEKEGVWCVFFEGENCVFPFAKISKQMEHGLEDSIGSLFCTVPVVFKDHINVPPPPGKP
jgi:hypothetical protein